MDSWKKGDVLRRIDLTPMPLGIETVGGKMTVILKKYSNIPRLVVIPVSTSMDNQCEMSIRLFEGESEVAVDNVLLVALELTGMPPAPAGIPRIQLTLEIGSTGDLKLTAKECTSGYQEFVVLKDYVDRIHSSLEDVDVVSQRAMSFCTPRVGGPCLPAIVSNEASEKQHHISVEECD